MSEPARPVYEFGEYQLDLSNKALMRKGKAVPLTPKVFDTLVLLVENSGQLVEKEQFLRQLWPDSFVEEAAVAESISRLRKALGDTEGQRFIVTVPKRGYRFVADIKKTSLAETAAPTGSVEPSSRWARGVALLGITILLAAGIAYISFRSPRAFPSAASQPIRSLAVMPFENLSHDPEQEYFADGTTDELITHLAKIGGIQVISRTSVMRYKGTRKPVAQIAQELRVDAVVEGTIMRSGERMRVTAQVIRASPEMHLWADQYDRQVGDILILQGELTREIAHAIQIKLTPKLEASLAAPRPVNREAHEAYLKGRYYWGKRTEERTRKAMEYFEQAIAKDPAYAQAFSGLADSYLSLALAEALQEALSPNDAFPKARAAANRALEIDDTIAEPHASLGHIRFLYDRDWPGAEREFKRAIELDTNYSNAHNWYALGLVWMERTDDALMEIRQARDLDPLSLTVNATFGFILGASQQYDAAVEQFRKTLEMDQNFALAYYRLGQIYNLKGSYAEAVQPLQKAISLSGGSPRATAELGLAYGRLGRQGEALKLIEELKRESTLRPVSAFDMATIYGGLGDKVRTLEWLEKAYQERSPSLNLLKRSPAFAGLHSEARFSELVRRSGLPFIERGASPP